MANILDYIKWRGDLSILQDGFNEIDSLILSRFSYLPFDNIIKENEVVTIRELSDRFKKEDMNQLPILWKNDIDLFPLMGESKRVGEMRASKYVNKINIEQEKQFSAITIILPDDTIYVSFRGTDNTLVGWKEDFNMSFKNNVPSQIDAVKYLEKIAKMYPNKLRIGGHSKGGNLAVYACLFVNDNVKYRIMDIYNNDGPGFSDEITETKEYKEMIEKVITYIPQDSIFGRLLNHKEKYTVVKSTQKGIMQHDLYSWQVLGNKFIYLKEVTNGSKFINKSIKDWYEQIDVKQREYVIDILFEIINKTQVETIPDFKKEGIANATIILKSYKLLDQESKKMILETLTGLIRVAKDNFLEEHKKPKK